MKNLFEIDEWKIVQNQYEPSKQLQAESIFSIGNGSFGQRANFEEHYSGPTPVSYTNLRSHETSYDLL